MHSLLFPEKSLLASRDSAPAARMSVLIVDDINY